MEAVKRSSIASLTRRRSGSAERSNKKDKNGKDKKAVGIGPAASKAPAITLDIIAESPPALLLGPPEQSSGALYACKLKVNAAADRSVTLRTLRVTFSVRTTTQRPVAEKCPDCSTQTTILKEWNLLSQPKTVTSEDSFPLSYLIPGTADVTVKGQVASIDYRFDVTATQADSDQVFELSKPLFVNRALRRGNDKTSKRIFPPLSICMNITTPSVVFPSGSFNVITHMTGVTSPKLKDRSMRWRLKKLDWRIIETEKVISPPCVKHAPKVGSQSHGIAHEHSRVLASHEMKSGWKSDFADDQISCEIECAIEATLRANTTMQPGAGGRVMISHALHMELVFAEEVAMDDRPDRPVLTGNARVLRTHFPLQVTARSGMGVAWDDEQPPLYEDVPESPPVYFQVESFDAPGLVTGSVERVQL